MKTSPVPLKTPAMKRLFLALLPEKALVEKLVRLQKELPGRMSPRENLHMTMAFLGSRPASDVFKIARRMDTVTFKPIEIVLDRIGCFPKVETAWIGPASVPPDLMKLHSDIRGILVPDFLPDRKETFRAHITLARRCVLAEKRAAGPFVFRAERLALMESVLGSRPGEAAKYRILHEITAQKA